MLPRGGNVLYIVYSTQYDIFLPKAKKIQLDTSSILTARGRGYPSTEGPGSGNSHLEGGSGAGHGGTGGRGKQARVGVAYGSVTGPQEFGSGGGRGTRNLVC